MTSKTSNMTTFLKKGIGKVVPLTVLPSSPNKDTDRIAVATKKSIELILLKQIIYFKAAGNYTEIYLTGGTKILTSLTLKKYAEYVPDGVFMRVHQSYLIQREKITKVKLVDNVIILSNGLEVPVSRNNKKTLIDYMKTMMP